MTETPSPVISAVIRFSSAVALPTFKDPGGGISRPYVSGSMLKGVLRRAAEKVLEIKGIPHCSGSKQLETCADDPCLLCSIFGSRFALGKVIFGSALPVVEGLREEKDMTPLQRGTRRHAVPRGGERECAGGAVLAFMPHSFKALLSVIQPLSADEEHLLFAAIRSIKTLGGGKAYGMGFCSIEAKGEAASTSECIQKYGLKEIAGNRLGVILVAEGPVCVPRTTVGRWFRDTLDYIPGAAVRAAFYDEARRLQNDGEVGSDQVSALTSSSVSFSDCLPVGSFISSPFDLEATSSREYPLVLPLSAALTCEASPAAAQARGGVFKVPDTLIANWALKECYGSGLPYVIGPAPNLRARDQLAGADSVTLWKGQAIFTDRTLASFCPRGRDSMRSVVRRRHAVSFLSPHTVFLGTIKTLRPASKEALKRLAGAKLSVGALRSRGFGRVSVAFVTAQERPTVRKSIEGFNKAVRSELGRYVVLWEGAKSVLQRIASEGRLFFSISLQSDLMLPKWSLWEGASGSALENLLLELGITAKVVYCYSKSRTRGGWNAACRAPHGLMPIVCRGGVFMLEASAPGRKMDDLCSKLEELQDAGLGLRRNDGFGAISVCDSFHWAGLIDDE